MEKNKLATLIFCPFFDNRQKFAKEDDVSKKKWGSPASLSWPAAIYWSGGTLFSSHFGQVNFNECRFLSRVEGKMSRVEGQISRVEGQMSRVEGKISRVESKMSRVESKMSRVESKMSRVQKCL